ncbi:MAG: hypothetical protein ACLQA5_23750 [Solirubrobacteraceae bacterium]
MTASYPKGSVIALVGEGFGSLLMHCTARYLGLKSRETTIFGTNDGPVATYEQYACNLGQTVLRSEFESHFLAPTWPTFAQLDACPHKSPKPFWRTRSETVGRLPGSDRPAALLSPTPGAARMG